MSYSDLSDQFAIVTRHIKKGSAFITNLLSFFKNYKKCYETHYTSFQKISENLATDVQDDSSTLEIAVNGLHLSLKKSLQESQNLCKNIQLEIIDPLEVFLEHYTETVMPYINAGDNSVKQLTKAKEHMAKVRRKYYQHSATAEKAEKSSSEDKNVKNIGNLRNLANKSSEDYIKAIDIVNKHIEDFDKTMPETMAALQQNEESRIHFLRIILEKFIKQINKSQTLAIENFESVYGLLNNVNSQIDIKVFVDTHKGRYKGGVKEEFVSYQKWRDKRKEVNEAEVREGDENYDELLEKAVGFLVFGDETDSDSSMSEMESEEQDFSKISESFKQSVYRNLFLDILESKKHRCSLGSQKMMLLVSYLKALISSIIVDQDKDPYVFCKILNLLHSFYHDSADHKRKYISDYLSSHTIWSDKLRWVEAIEYTTALKIVNDKESLKQYPKPLKKKSLFGALKNIATKIPGVFQKEINMEESEKTAAFIVITQFSFYMSHLSLTLDAANSIILLCCQRANLDSNRTTTLLAELEASQRTSLSSFTPVQHSLKLREKERKNYGKCLPVGISMNFLHPSECVELLFVCKSWYSSLQVPILKKCLMDWDLPELNTLILRRLTWLRLLKSNLREIDYDAFLNKVKSSHSAESEEVIALDVMRSYQNSLVVPSESLSNILRVYAFYNSEVGYCQGMNYIAGTIYSHFHNEATSLQFMVALIDKFHMTELFTTDLPKLKQFFYQLDRLIGIELPELHELFKQVNVSSGHFCAPWFITLFASHLQNRLPLLSKIWDLFIINGWKSVFKIAIVILKRLSKGLVYSKFEDIMFGISSIQSNNPVIEIFDDSFIKDVINTNITASLLKELEAEYSHLKSRAEKHTKSI